MQFGVTEQTEQWTRRNIGSTKSEIVASDSNETLLLELGQNSARRQMPVEPTKLYENA